MAARKPNATGKRKAAGGERWVARVMASSNALDLPEGIFTWRSARRIAAALKKAAESSRRRKGTPYQSAMSMLTFEINRAGRALTPTRRATLEKAKDELRRLFDRPVHRERRAA